MRANGSIVRVPVRHEPDIKQSGSIVDLKRGPCIARQPAIQPVEPRGYIAERVDPVDRGRRARRKPRGNLNRRTAFRAQQT